MVKYITILALNLSLIAAPGNHPSFNDLNSKTYRDTRKLLDSLANIRTDSDKLAALFRVGDERIQDLIQALDDPAKNISLRAQIVIRYLGNPEGMKGLTEWYQRQSDQYPVAGPVPLPLTELDYKFITLNLIGKPASTWGDRGVQYVYALALDDTSQSRTMLDTMISSAPQVDQVTVVGYALKQAQQVQPSRVLPATKNLPRLIVHHAFFVPTQDHKHTTARLLGLNGPKDKALVEVHINRGSLAEEWYHVVLKKHAHGWKFFSITQVAVS